MTRTIVVVTAGLGSPSSTRLLADQLAAATDRALRLHDEPAQVEVIELRDLAHALTDHLLTGFPSGPLAEAVDAVRRADALVAVTPIFTASYSGLFKTFFDVLEECTLEGLPVLLGATAGTARHSLALEFAMRPLFAYLRARVMPTAVFAASDDFASSGRTGSLSARVEQAGRELAEALVGPAGQEGRDGPARPGRLGSRARGPVDPFENPTSFEELLRG
jgi:FMN reductase